MTNKINPAEEVEILIVEDSPTQAEQLRYVLEQNSYRVTVANNGREALDHLDKHIPTLIITDIVMPGMNGYELCQKIKADEKTKDIPVILLTSLTDAEDILEGLACGADNFISKPYNEQYLLSNLSNILVNRKLRKNDLVRVGVEIRLGEKRRFITADQQQMLSMLISTYEAAVNRNKELILARDELRTINERLEEIVEKRTEDLSASEVRYRRLFEAAKDGILIVDADTGVINEVNPYLSKLLGKGCGQILGKKIWELGFLKDIIANKANFEELRKKEYIRFEDNPLETADGGGIDVEFVSNVYEVNGRKVIQCNIRDITERKRAAENLQAALVIAHEGKTRAEAIMTSMGEGLSIQDTDFIIVYQNKILKDLRGDHIGEHCYTAYENNDHVCEGCPVVMAFRDGGIHKAERSVINGKDTLHVEITTSPLRDIQGNIVAGIEVIRDVSNQKKLEAQLRQSQKMEAVGTLAGGIAHDFNNILNVIMGYGAIVMETLEAGSHAMEDMNEVLSAADKAADITKRLLVFSRQQAVEMRSVNINEIILGLQKLLVRVVRENIKYNLDLADRPLMVLADAGGIEQVLINLAANAGDAMPEGGKLTISTGIEEVDEEYAAAYGYGKIGRYALITVADTGQGMDAETQKKIFEPFFTTKDIGKGTGLGLSISYGIIRQHDGYIKVYSEPGQGAVFKIFLPLDEEAISPDRKTEAVAFVKGGNETVLVAEDDASLRKLTKTILESFGYSVISAEDGEDAVSKFMENRERISLVLLDMIMPKKSGKEVSEAIIKVAPRMKVLFASGYALDNITNRELAEAGFDFIHKPFRPKDLLAKVRAVLDR